VSFVNSSCEPKYRQLRCRSVKDYFDSICKYVRSYIVLLKWSIGIICKMILSADLLLIQSQEQKHTA
jgi:hypothetical protein